MTARRIARVATVSWITIFGPALAVTPAALADPTDVVGPEVPGPPVVTESDAVASDAAVTACKQWADAMDVAAANYSDFADVTSGDRWNYGDPVVASANVTGRTALRQAAAAAAEASHTQGSRARDRQPHALVVAACHEAPVDHGPARKQRHDRLCGESAQRRRE
jgi:hypothetical protein